MVNTSHVFQLHDKNVKINVWLQSCLKILSVTHSFVTVNWHLFSKVQTAVRWQVLWRLSCVYFIHGGKNPGGTFPHVHRSLRQDSEGIRDESECYKLIFNDILNLTVWCVFNKSPTSSLYSFRFLRFPENSDKTLWPLAMQISRFRHQVLRQIIIDDYTNLRSNKDDKKGRFSL